MIKHSRRETNFGNQTVSYNDTRYRCSMWRTTNGGLPAQINQSTMPAMKQSMIRNMRDGSCRCVFVIRIEAFYPRIKSGIPHHKRARNIARLACVKINMAYQQKSALEPCSL
jgi:hypothetical protein